MAGNSVDVLRFARYAAETYSTPEQFATPEEYTQALTEVLDELATITGHPLPKIEEAWK